MNIVAQYKEIHIDIGMKKWVTNSKVKPDTVLKYMYLFISGNKDNVKL